MRRASYYFPILALLTALGCSQQQPRAVFVDVNSVLASDPAFVAPAVKTPTPPRTVGPSSLVLNAMPGRTLVDHSHGQIAEAKRILEQDRQQALRSLETRLRTIYSTEIDAKAQAALAARLPKDQAILNEAY